ncbi:MAG: S-layer protein [Methanoregula sp.]|nr:S-layer protein [Methanoregula sp.]
MVTAVSAVDPTVIVSGYTVTPSVLMSGDTGTITMTIRNTAEVASEKENSGIVQGGTFASTKSTDINVFIENVHLDPNGITVLNDDFDRIGELGPGQSVPVTFVIRAPDKSGIYFPEAWIDVKDGRSTRFPMLVNVNTDIATQKKSSLAVTRILPEQVAPGEDFTAQLIIENAGLTRAGDISIVVNSSQKSVALTSTGRYYIASLDPGEKFNIDLQFVSDRNTPTGVNPVTLAITYANLDGTTERQTETLGVLFKGRADIAISSVTSDPIRPVPGNPFTLIVRVENTGTDRATSVRTLLDSGFTTTRDAFIGSIDKDSDAPAIFYLQATRDGTIPATITVRYQDDYGNHTISETTTVTTAPANSLPLMMAGLLLIACAGAGAAYWYYRIRPGKRNGD